METTHEMMNVETCKAALRAFFRVTSDWGLTPAQEQVVLGVDSAILHEMRSGILRAVLEHATQERLSYVFRIYGALEILLPIPERAGKWMTQENSAPLFGGTSALSRVLCGQVDDLKVVADYLDSRCGGDFA